MYLLISFLLVVTQFSSFVISMDERMARLIKNNGNFAKPDTHLIALKGSKINNKPLNVNISLESEYAKSLLRNQSFYLELWLGSCLWEDSENECKMFNDYPQFYRYNEISNLSSYANESYIVLKLISSYSCPCAILQATQCVLFCAKCNQLDLKCEACMHGSI